MQLRLNLRVLYVFQALGKIILVNLLVMFVLKEFQPLSGQTGCVNCTPGYYQNYAGQTKCFTCNPGTYSSTTEATHARHAP